MPIYTESATPTPPDRLPERERKRQASAAKESFYALLLVGGRVACGVGRATVHPHDFSVRFDASVQLRLLVRPATLALQVWQRRMGGLADRLVSEVFLAVPATASPVMPQWQHYAFADERSFQPLRERADAAAEERAAAGESQEGLDGVTPVARNVLSGALEVLAAWTTRPADKLAGGAHASAAQELALASAALDAQHMWSAVMPDELDPNAPQDVPLLALLARTERGSMAGMFRAMRNQAALQWSASWAPSDRYSLFAMRRKHPAKWAQLPAGEKAVPTKDSGISSSMRELLRPAADFDAAIDKYEQDKAAQEKASKVKAWVAQVRRYI